MPIEQKIASLNKCKVYSAARAVWFNWILALSNIERGEHMPTTLPTLLRIVVRLAAYLMGFKTQIERFFGIVKEQINMILEKELNLVLFRQLCLCLLRKNHIMIIV